MIDTDQWDVLSAEAQFRFEDVNWRSKWIKNTHMVDIVVPYGKDGREIVSCFLTGEELSPRLRSVLQHHVVSVYPQDYNKLVGLLQKISLKEARGSGLDLYYMPIENAKVFYRDDLGIVLPEDFDDEEFFEAKK
jgi:hypothetical protein